MITILFYLYTIAFFFIFAMYTKYQLKDEKLGLAHSTGEWHPYGMIMRIMLPGAFMVGYYVIPYVGWKDWFLLAAIVMPLWDISINVFALKVPAFYVGYTAKLDKKFKNIKWIAYAIILSAAIVLKFSYA